MKYVLPFHFVFEPMIILAVIIQTLYRLTQQAIPPQCCL